MEVSFGVGFSLVPKHVTLQVAWSKGRGHSTNELRQDALRSEVGRIAQNIRNSYRSRDPQSAQETFSRCKYSNAPGNSAFLLGEWVPVSGGSKQFLVTLKWPPCNFEKFKMTATKEKIECRERLCQNE